MGRRRRDWNEALAQAQIVALRERLDREDEQRWRDAAFRDRVRRAHERLDSTGASEGSPRR